MALIVLLLIVQIWLLSATLDAYLAGHREVVLPGAIIQGYFSCLWRSLPIRCAFGKAALDYASSAVLSRLSPFIMISSITSGVLATIAWFK